MSVGCVTDAVAVGGRPPAFGPGTGPVFFQVMLCTGNETELINCPSSDSGFFSFFCATHLLDAAVICRGKGASPT